MKVSYVVRFKQPMIWITEAPRLGDIYTILNKQYKVMWVEGVFRRSFDSADIKIGLLPL